jgi:uncharacterized protein (DUF885 family)
MGSLKRSCPPPHWRRRVFVGRGLLLACSLPITVSAAAPAATASGDEVRAVGAEYLAALSEDSLFLRLKTGLPIERFPDLSLAHAEARGRQAEVLLARLAAVPDAALEGEDRLSRDLLRRKLAFEVDAPRRYWLGFDVTPYASPFGQAHQALRALPLWTRAEADAYLALLAKYAGFVGEVRARLRGQAEGGIRVPKDELPIVLSSLRAALDLGPASPFAVAQARLDNLTAPERASFEQALAPLAAQARAALEGLVGELGGDYAAKAPDQVGLSQYPGGRAAYASLVKLHTTLDVTPEEVHRIGLEEVSRIVARMTEVRKKLGFTGTAAEFREAIRKDSRFRAQTPDEVAERLLSYVTRIEPKVDAFFLRRPKAQGSVKRLDAEREPALTFGIYEPPSATEPRGLYRFNGSKLEERSLLTAGPLIYHELVPGHHFQIALAAENEGLPMFRRELWDTAYVEGWGEYAAALAEEMGMYADPYDLYGRLSMDMFLSVRLVVDTGMNTLGWPRAKAVAYMREHLMESDTQIETESLRYSTDIPGQALAYKMGSRVLWDMRRKAEAALGPRFDVRRFHDCILGSGSLPLATLARKVDQFVEAERQR